MTIEKRKADSQVPLGGWRAKAHEIIFESDTPMGKAFDTTLILFVIASVAAVMLDSVPRFNASFGAELLAAEWFFTIVFTVEYLLRLFAVKRPISYALSFYGIIDLLAIMPTYLSIFIPGSQSLLVIRSFRLLRVFRVFKLLAHLGEAQMLAAALSSSRPKITVFLIGVSAAVITSGTIMYLIEGPENGFTSIPTAIYWSVVTLTTVGFGDITPKTPLGQAVASLIMILGYGIIAVPTGIVTTELVLAARQPTSNQACPSCSAEGHAHDAHYCRICGSHL